MKVEEMMVVFGGGGSKVALCWVLSMVMKWRGVGCNGMGVGPIYNI